MAAMSTMRNVGFVGVSTHTNLVFGVMAAATLAGSSMSTKVNFTPNGSKILVKRR